MTAPGRIADRSARPAAEPIIRMIGVDKAFGDHVVYRDMYLDVPKGQTTTIIGPSGGGKSVCMKMIIGLLRPDRGRILVDGADVTEMGEEELRALRRRVAYVFQGGALFDSMTVADNVAYGLREHTDLSEEEIDAKVRACLDMVGLSDDLLDEMPSSLSGGMKKRVALARSIAMEPDVILYDEPTTGLDPKNIAVIGDMILKLQSELGVTSLVVTHDMPMAFRVSDHIAMLSDHKFPFVGTPYEMATSEVDLVRDFVHGRIADAP
ncbi:MAG: ABC transporter ATP-binding protein [Deltaproteobacteria bacterium]|nr:MAG: ABC transporter ATP-binding protein [Deltaproteobacteria bacterium]